MICKTTRNVWIQAVSGIRIVTCCLTFAALLLGTSHDVLAQKKNKNKVPPGNPFQALQRQIDELRGRLECEFEQLRVSNPDGPSTLFWGPTDECSIGIDPPGGLTGLIERDPIGFRLIGPDGQGCRLIFGPTLDCTVEVNPDGPAGLLLRDPTGIRVINPDPAGESRLLFGPTDDCTIGIDPSGDLTGLIERDPVGFRLLGPGGQGCRLIFGPTLDCTVEVDPEGPDGLLLRDVSGIRLLNPDPDGATALRFGPSDECSLRIDPPGGLTGLIESDPNGLRLLGPEGQGCILTFGPTDLCRIFVDPNPDEPGLNFSDPSGFFFDNNVTIAGTVVAENIGQASSRSLKENIQPLDDALAKIQRLQGVSFDWKPQHGGRPDIGFIAEDVHQVLPELVIWDEKHEAAKGVKYANIVAVAVEGIKAQQKQIEDLQTENDTLRKDFASLQAQMDDLSAKMGQLLNVGAE